MDIHCQRDKNRVTLFSSKYNIPKTIIFDISRAHLSVSFFFLRCSGFSILHYILFVNSQRIGTHYTHTHRTYVMHHKYLYFVHVPRETCVKCHLTRRTVNVYRLADIVFRLHARNPRAFSQRRILRYVTTLHAPPCVILIIFNIFHLFFIVRVRVPVVTMFLSWNTVWNDGASADTSHLYVPLLDSSNDLSTTSFEFDLSI